MTEEGAHTENSTTTYLPLLVAVATTAGQTYPEELIMCTFYNTSSGKLIRLLPPATPLSSLNLSALLISHYRRISEGVAVVLAVGLRILHIMQKTEEELVEC